MGLFGSYGWGSGEWLQDWHQRCKDHGAKVYKEGVMINNTPDEVGLKECADFAQSFVQENF